MNTMERAHETIEEVHHGDNWTRNVAVLISILAATLALTDFGGKAAQNAYLTHHVWRSRTIGRSINRRISAR
jgi:hypothetical protein